MDGRNVTISGKRWRLRYVPMRRWAGECDPPSKPHKEIRLSRALLREPSDRVRVLVHEALHAAQWHIDEEAVEQFAQDVARILVQEGLVSE